MKHQVCIMLVVAEKEHHFLQFHYTAKMVYKVVTHGSQEKKNGKMGAQKVWDGIMLG